MYNKSFLILMKKAYRCNTVFYEHLQTNFITHIIQILLTTRVQQFPRMEISKRADLNQNFFVEMCNPTRRDFDTG
jgi:hypothetical protein